MTDPSTRGERSAVQSLWACEPSQLAEQLGALAQAALLAEARLTPKPALVDQCSQGAHQDLNLALLERSAAALRSGFTAMATLASDSSLSPQALRIGLAALGRSAESAMQRATGGANAHRGAIWALGLCCAAAAQAVAQTGHEPRAHALAWWPEQVLARVAAIAACPDVHQLGRMSHGQLVRRRYGLPGALEEAQSGFPHVLRHGLPALRQARARGLSEACARLDTLLSLMVHLPDTCLLHRGGLVALRSAQVGAARVLGLGGCSTGEGQQALVQLHQSLMVLWASPGGSADLLATTLFLDALSQSGSARMLLVELTEAQAHGNTAF